MYYFSFISSVIYGKMAENANELNNCNLLEFNIARKRIKINLSLKNWDFGSDLLANTHFRILD